ncbi:MAG: PQQ-binding-like beta-propeller repeat protein, partial [Planctomycetota bacterium]
MYKGGPSLVALDQITGQLKWAYGPMVASTVEEARMRFEAVPAGGPRTIYAGYILDNIEGDAHIDTEYGVIAFESATGRVRWRKELCRLTPGKFAAGFARRVRNRIRSYASPPLYHQGTVYWSTNAGTVAALDARSGRIKWLTRYPYYRSIHDATRAFGGFRRYTPRNMNDIILWYPQRPLIVGDSLYVLPVDTKMMFRMDRRSGQVIWTRVKGAYRNERGSTIGSSAAYFLGPIATGELVVAYSSRRTPVHLVDPKTGKTVWRSGDLVAPIGHPVMHHYFYFGSGRSIGAGADGWHYQLAARPFLCSDGSLTLTGFHYWGYSVYGWVTNLCRVSLPDREIVGRRRYLSGEIVARASHDIHYAATLLEELEELPHKSEKVKARMRAYKAMSSDTVPANRHGPFLPHCRLTFKRYGELFELRFGARDVAMVYDRAAVNRVLAGRTGPTADFAKAELAIDNARYRDAAGLLKKCLATISSEDLDFRAIINQQLYRVHRQIARSAIRARDPDRELRHCLGLSRTAGELADEIETLFALSEAYHRKGRDARAARCLQSIINTYGHREYPLPRAAVMGEERLLDAARRVMDEAAAYVNKDYYGREMLRSLKLMTQGLPVYASALSPLPKDFSMRAEDLAAIKLRGLLAESPELTSQLESQARRELLGRDREEQFYRLAEFAGTETAQTVLEALFKGAGELDGIASLRRMWRLADAARVCGLTVPKPYLEAVAAPDERPAPVPLKTPFEERTHRFHDEEGQARLMLERRGQRSRHRNLAFFGERVRKRLDNKFVLGCMDLETGAIRWTVSRIRLKGHGQEPGFFEAFVYRDLVVVHGLYDVLAYGIEDHQLKWRYRVPFDFEIRSAVMSGDLLVLSGSTETIALYLPTPNPAGEVVWQEGEQGDAYIPPYFTGDRLVLVRKMPFNVTVRYRSTGKLIGRLDLPDLSLHRDHPLLQNGRKELSVAHEAGLLVVTDGWYYVAVDTDAMRTLWKRLIDANDRTREPPIRFYLGGDYLAVVKEDYDVKAIYMLAGKTG